MQIEPTRIVAIRHGETAWNRETRMQGQLDIALNANGLRQARSLAAALADEAFDAIYSSDLLRAHQTAQALAASYLAPIVTDVGLRERGFGVFEGFTFNEIAARWPEQSERWRRRDPDFAPDGGESLRDFYARSIEATTRLAAAHPGETIALVAHGGVMDCLYRAAARLDLQAPRSWQLLNASVNRLLLTESGLTLVGWNDTYHLEDSSLDESGDGETAAERLGRPGALGGAT